MLVTVLVTIRSVSRQATEDTVAGLASTSARGTASTAQRIVGASVELLERVVEVGDEKS
jgi:hypothetical protein